MHVDLWLQQAQNWVLTRYHGLTYDELYNIWAISGAILLLIWLYVSYGIIRRALGHRKFRGTWYNEHEFEQLLKMIHEDNERGHRVMRLDEMQLLRKWVFGNAKGLSDHLPNRW